MPKKVYTAIHPISGERKKCIVKDGMVVFAVDPKLAIQKNKFTTYQVGELTPAGSKILFKPNKK